MDLPTFRDLLTPAGRGALAEAAWSDDRVRAEAEVAALMLDQVTARLSLWPEVVEARCRAN